MSNWRDAVLRPASYFKPRKGQEHCITLQLAEQLNQEWTLALWVVDKLK